jgi:hypothetical protein
LVGRDSASGIISDLKTGEPVSNATVLIGGTHSASAITDPSGRFCIYDLCPGDYLAEVSHDEYVRTSRRVVYDGQSGLNLDIGVVRAAWLTVTGVDRQGARLRTPMRFHLIEVGGVEGEGVQYGARCTSEGTFVLRGVAPGQYLLSVVTDAAAGSVSVTAQEGENRVEIAL